MVDVEPGSYRAEVAGRLVQLDVLPGKAVFEQLGDAERLDRDQPVYCQIEFLSFASLMILPVWGEMANCTALPPT